MKKEHLLMLGVAAGLAGYFLFFKKKSPKEEAAYIDRIVRPVLDAAGWKPLMAPKPEQAKAFEPNIGHSYMRGEMPNTEALMVGAVMGGTPGAQFKYIAIHWPDVSKPKNFQPFQTNYPANMAEFIKNRVKAVKSEE